MPSPPLNQQQRAFVVNFARHGMLQTQAAKAAGYAFPSVEAARLMKLPYIVEAVQKERGRVEKVADVSRKKVIDGLMEAFECAKLQADAIGMVAGLREVAKICGYYAPETKQIQISVNAATTVAQIEELSDEELVKLIIEGESARVPDDGDDLEDGAVKLLPPPEAEPVDDDAAD